MCATPTTWPWKLIGVLKGKIAATALLSYESERRDHAWALIKLALNLGRVMAPATVLRAGLISSAFRLIGLLPPLRDYFLQMRFKPKPRFTNGLVLTSGKAGQLSCGQMFPQPLLTDVLGQETLLDHSIGSGFALIQYANLNGQGFGELQHELWAHLDAKRILILPPHAEPGQSVPGCTVLHDRQGMLKSVLGDANTFLLLRPDRYIAAIFAPSSEAPTAASLQRTFGIPLAVNSAIDVSNAPLVH